MTADQGRKWLILSSLIITGIQVIFLFVAPALGYPLTYPKNLYLLQIVTPVFLGYLGSAAHFVFTAPPPEVTVNNQFLGPLVKGPITIYACAMVAAFGTFGYSNREGVQIGSAMTVDNLATAISISLGILAVTTGVIISYLFTGKPPENKEPIPNPAPAPHLGAGN